MFIDSNEAGWRSAVIYSIIESCPDRGVDPYVYLKDVLTRLPTMTNWEGNRQHHAEGMGAIER